jgi:hypothetical protein
MDSLTTTNNQIEKLSSTTQKWVEKYNKLEVKTYADCFPSETVLTLKSIVRKELQKEAKKVVYSAVANFAVSFNITNNFKVENGLDQIHNLVNDIFEFYSFLTISDIKLFLQQVKLGKFDKNYNRLDAPLLFGYLEEYCQNRLVAIENDNDRYKSQNNVFENSILLQKIAPLFNQQEKERQHTEELKEFQIIAKEKIRLKQEAIEGYVARVHKEFCELHRLQGSKQGTMFVTYRKKQMNFEEYYQTIFDETYNKKD